MTLQLPVPVSDIVLTAVGDIHVRERELLPCLVPSSAARLAVGEALLVYLVAARCDTASLLF